MEGVLDLALSDSDPSLSSTSKRKRAKKGTACTACRVKKRRCDGGKPSCTPCIRDSEPVCVYTVLKLRARTAILQDKVNQLEAQVTLLESAFNAADIGLDASTIFARITGRSAHSGASERSLSTASLKTQSKELLCQLQTQLQSSASSPLGSWWNTDEEPPSGLVAILANRFAKYEHQFTHDLLPAEFYESLRDPDPDTGPHPGLRNVIFLIACHYSPGPLSILESVFLRRARSHLSESLARTDRLLDYVEAQTLLGTYYINKGRCSKYGSHDDACCRLR
ncbi:hypothetical protein BOTBODRAFT_257159 [Botryobasidium botryosum FD-172 SS1]|uniref:Zn(2)-C6 fungal-type domain-containing protein n=1 Tax=Botryobasidium botryosum (strain FD-172 SS1) TaxID=930990 RepID=A0A067MNB0_BOTB1|nr:hypothetical protein BOTBODRAFT_257159 [Botryobasidium botryosum FD-172 SS1]